MIAFDEEKGYFKQRAVDILDPGSPNAFPTVSLSTYTNQSRGMGWMVGT